MSEKTNPETRMTEKAEKPEKPEKGKGLLKTGRQEAVFMSLLNSRLDISRLYDKWMSGSISEETIIETVRIRLANFASFNNLSPKEYVKRTADFSRVISEFINDLH